MAQTGFTPIQLYYSTTGGATPTAMNLVDGELAINIADGKLFYKNGASVFSIASKATAATTGTNAQLLANDGSGGYANVTIGSGISYAGGTLSATGTGGTVTSVSWTGGIVSIASATTTPAFTIAGTSGGIPYFSSGTTWATSAELAANSLVIGGGAGAAPSTTTTGTGVITALGNNTNSANGLPVLNASGYLSIAQGGTNSNATPTAGGVSYGTGTALAYTGSGTSGQVLTSAGSSPPVWADPAGGGAQAFITQFNGGNQPPGAFSPSNSFALI